jgi:formate-dependent phosphoribosylglycinamide formyltransferase (GAR transformylase)
MVTLAGTQLEFELHLRAILSLQYLKFLEKKVLVIAASENSTNPTFTGFRKNCLSP